MKVYLLVSGILLAVSSVYAQEVIDSEALVVSAQRNAQSLADANVSINVINKDDLVLQGADTLSDALKDTPAVAIENDGTPGIKRVSLRGEGAYRTLLLVDGERITDQKTKSGAPFLVNPFFIDKVEVVRGPSSVLYGSDAMGGIVNVITKTPDTKKIAIDVGLLYNGSNNAFSQYLNLSGTIDSFSYALGLTNTDAHDLYKSDRERIDNTSYRNKGLNAYLAWQATNKLKFDFKSEYFDTDAHTASSTDVPEYSEFKAHIPKWQRLKNSIGFEVLEINDYVASVKGNFFIQKNEKDFNSEVSKQGPFVFVANDEKSIGANLQAKFLIADNFNLITGYDLNIDKLDADSRADIGGPISANIKDRDYKQNTHALYALLSSYFYDNKLIFNTGVRYNRVDTKSGESYLNVLSVNQDLSVHHDEVNEKAVLSAGAVFKPDNKLSLRLNWSQGYRVPTIQEMYLTTFTGEMQIGNPQLKPETSDNYELGLRYDGDIIVSDIAVFYNEADDYIETVRDDSLFPELRRFKKYTYKNIASAKTFGAEWSFKAQFESFEPYFDLALIKRKYNTGTESTYNTGLPTLKGRGGIKYFPQCDYGLLTLDLYSRFASKAKQDNSGGISYFADDNLGGYTTFNLGAEFLFGDDYQYKVYGALENITDKNYRTSSLIHEPGRFFMAGISASF